MKSILLLIGLVALSSSSAPGRSPHEALMDEIERQIRLPPAAEPLAAYGRYYALGGKGRVVAVYLLPLEPTPLPADWGCEEMLEIGNKIASRPIPCPPGPDTPYDLVAGQRRWVAGRNALPMVSDGGCMIVNVTFNLRTREVEHAFCNGEA
ncbi:MAG TPA: hypothetical protein VF652_02390 [Allosphingosinicella sp.]|jgi:hypothetical protein